MTFAVDMPAAARRHFLAAEILAPGHRKDVAGYLYGLASECALKAMMIEAGMRPPQGDMPHRDNPFFAHFPELRTMLCDSLNGRRSITLAKFVQDNSFMNNWSVRMRYSHGKDIQGQWITAWAKQSKNAVACIGT